MTELVESPSEPGTAAVRRLRHRARTLRARSLAELAAAQSAALPHTAAALRRRAAHLMRLGNEADAQADQLQADERDAVPPGATRRLPRV